MPLTVLLPLFFDHSTSAGGIGACSALGGGGAKAWSNWAQRGGGEGGESGGQREGRADGLHGRGCLQIVGRKS